MNTVPDGAVAVTLSLAARRGGLPEKKGSSPTPIRRRRKTSGVSIWMWMILCINIITDNENKKDRMIIAYPSIIM